MTPKTLDPLRLAKPFSRYSHAAEAPGAWRWLHVSGQVGVTADGTLLEGFEAQATQAWTNVRTVLDEAGMKPADLVKVTMLLTREEDVPASRTTRDAALAGAKPACTLFVVAGLADLKWLIEVEAIAAAPDQAAADTSL